MDWTKLNETIDPRWHEIDDPIPVYHSKEKLEPKQIYISTADIYNTPYYQMYEEYLGHLAYQYSCRPSTYYIKVSENFERGLRAKISSLYNDVITEDGLTFMTNEEIADKFNSIGCTSFMLTPEQIEKLTEQHDKENKQCST